MGPNKQSGRWTAAFLLASALVLPVVVLVLAALLNYRDARQDAFARGQRLTTAVGEHALRTFRAHELIIDLVDAYLRDVSWGNIIKSPYIVEVLKRVSRDKEDVSSVHLASPTGRNTISNVGKYLAIDVTKRDYFGHAKESSGLFISEPAVGVASGRKIFSLAKRMSGDEKFRGAIVVSASPAYFSEFYKTLARRDGDAFALIRSDGTILARYPEVESLIRLPPNAPFLRAISEDRNGGRFWSVSAVDSVERIVSYRRVGQFDAYVVYAEPANGIWAAWWSRMVYYVIVCVCTALILLFAAQRMRMRTEQWLAESERRYQAELAGRKVAEQMVRERDTFIASVGHELRNPLSAISNGLELLRIRGAPKPASDAVDMCRRQVSMLRRLINDLLDVSRITYGKLTLELEKVDVCSMLKEVIDSFAVPSHITIRLQGSQVFAVLDRVRFEQVMTNLLSNSIKFGSTAIDVSLESSSEFFTVVVADNGKGIAEGMMVSLFEPFKQAEKSGMGSSSGLGLGLSIVKGLVSLHGGTVKAASDGIGHGTTVTISMPLLPPDCEVQATLADAS